jgi:dynein heavy chain
LTIGLADENVRWKATVESLNDSLKVVLGDAFMTSSCLAYYGPFTGVFREKMVNKWIEKCKEL